MPYAKQKPESHDGSCFYSELQHPKDCSGFSKVSTAPVGELRGMFITASAEPSTVRHFERHADELVDLGFKKAVLEVTADQLATPGFKEELNDLLHVFTSRGLEVSTLLFTKDSVPALANSYHEYVAQFEGIEKKALFIRLHDWCSQLVPAEQISARFDIRDPSEELEVKPGSLKEDLVESSLFELALDWSKTASATEKKFRKKKAKEKKKCPKSGSSSLDLGYVVTGLDRAEFLTRDDEKRIFTRRDIVKKEIVEAALSTPVIQKAVIDSLRDMVDETVSNAHFTHMNLVKGATERQREKDIPELLERMKTVEGDVLAKELIGLDVKFTHLYAFLCSVRANVESGRLLAESAADIDDDRFNLVHNLEQQELTSDELGGLLANFTDLLAEYEALRAEAVEPNLRIIFVKIPKIFLGSLSLEEAYEEGENALFAAFDGFDLSVETRFHSYAGETAMKKIIRLANSENIRTSRELSLAEDSEKDIPQPLKEDEFPIVGSEVMDFAREHLDEREALILEMRFLDDMTLKEIGLEIDLTRERVRQIESAGLAKLNIVFKLAGDMKKTRELADQFLTPSQQEVVHMLFGENKSYDEIATAMNKPVNNVRRIATTAFNRLRTALDEEAPESSESE